MRERAVQLSEILGHAASTLPVAPVALTPARMPSEQGTMKTALDTLRLRVTNPRPRLQSIRASRSQQQQRQDPFNPSISRQQSHPRQHDSVRAAQEFATAMEYTAVLLQSGQLDLESPPVGVGGWVGVGVGVGVDAGVDAGGKGAIASVVHQGPLPSLMSQRQWRKSSVTISAV
jgi:hypothetical protein